MTEPSQLNEYDMANMTPDEIGAAHKAGRFRDLLDPTKAPFLPRTPMGTTKAASR
jgi:hypothetical protein